MAWAGRVLMCGFRGEIQGARKKFVLPPSKPELPTTMSRKKRVQCLVLSRVISRVWRQMSPKIFVSNFYHGKALTILSLSSNEVTQLKLKLVVDRHNLGNS